MKRILFVLCSAMVFTSCLKDKNYDNRVSGHRIDDQKLVELVAPNSTVNLTAIALDFQNVETIVTILPVRISSTVPAPTDITITLDTTVTSSYLATHPALTHFKASLGSIVSPLTLTIPKGATESQPIQIKVNTSNFNPSNTYVIGFRIASISGDPSYVVNANYNTHYVTLSAKNAYDGIYSVISGNVQRYTGPGAPTVGDALNGPIGPANPDIILSTVGANTVTMPYSAALNGSWTWSPPNQFVAGIDGFTMTVDPATNLVTNASSTNATLINWPGKVNRYDPATRTFYVAFRWTSTAPAYREYEAVIRYKGPR